MIEKHWFLKKCSLFASLTDDQIQRLESVSQVKTFGRKELVYLPAEQSDAVLLVVSGRIRIYHISADGKEAVMVFIEPGEIFGELSVLGGQESVREEFAETMEKTALIKIPRDEIQRLMDVHPQLCVGITKLIGLRRQRLERRLKSLLFRSNRDRIVHLLVELAEQYGERSPEGIRLRLKLSHQELASIVGSTRETVTVILGELQTEGFLTIQRRQIQLKDLDRLAAIIGVEAPKIGSPALPPTGMMARHPT